MEQRKEQEERGKAEKADNIYVGVYIDNVVEGNITKGKEGCNVNSHGFYWMEYRVSCVHSCFVTHNEKQITPDLGGKMHYISRYNLFVSVDMGGYKESHLEGNVHDQGWQFYAALLALFMVSSSPGFVVKVLWK